LVYKLSRLFVWNIRYLITLLFTNRKTET
jgi:hypothetical protein